MSGLELARLNLLSPVVLAFVLGAVAVLVRSDLRIPEQLYGALSIYLLLSIGLRGGVELSNTSLGAFWKPALATLALGIAVPLWSYAILRYPGRFDVANAAALAAHYGSVSAVTFSASLTFLESLHIPYEGYMPTLVAFLEVPAIMVALLIARARMRGGGALGEALRELLTGRSILLLVGGLIIGYLSKEEGYKQVAPLFTDLFKGALAIFLLEMGMVAAGRFRDLRAVGPFLIGFGILMPIIHGTVGIALGSAVGLSLGGSFILGVLAASASYIAAPAAVRIALPEANPGYYLTAALAITFPFNLAIGLPLYYAIAQRFH
ncbi:MAG TPA: sodium-dependent bicarbonate transport family permease [Thermomicrobiales bacterium]|jgi:hypothetical protein